MKETHITVGKSVHGGIDLQFGVSGFSSKVTLTDEQTNWLIDELSNKLHGIRRPRIDKRSTKERIQRAAYYPQARAVFESMCYSDGWELVGAIAARVPCSEGNARTQLHSLKHAGFVESRVGETIGGRGRPLTEWRIVPGVTYQSAEQIRDSHVRLGDDPLDAITQLIKAAGGKRVLEDEIYAACPEASADDITNHIAFLWQAGLIHMDNGDITGYAWSKP